MNEQLVELLSRFNKYANAAEGMAPDVWAGLVGAERLEAWVGLCGLAVGLTLTEGDDAQMNPLKLNQFQREVSLCCGGSND